MLNQTLETVQNEGGIFKRMLTKQAQCRAVSVRHFITLLQGIKHGTNSAWLISDKQFSLTRLYKDNEIIRM